MNELLMLGFLIAMALGGFWAGWYIRGLEEETKRWNAKYEAEMGKEENNLIR